MGGLLAFVSYFLNEEGGTPDSVPGSPILAQRDYFGPRVSNLGSGTFAVWSTAGSVSAVPIPAAAWLFGSALLGLGVLKRKKA